MMALCLGFPTILLGLVLLGLSNSASASETAPHSVSFHPQARYYAPETVLLDGTPACLLVVRNDGNDTLRLQGAEGRRVFVDADRFWHGQALRMVVAFYRADGSVVTIAPGDSVFVEVLLMDLETDAFEARLYRAPGSAASTGAAAAALAATSATPADTASAVPDSTLAVQSGMITLNDAPYVDLLSKEQAGFAVRRGFPGAQVTRRHQGLIFDPQNGWIWRVSCLLNGNRQVHARVNAISGEVMRSDEEPAASGNQTPWMNR